MTDFESMTDDELNAAAAQLMGWRVVTLDYLDQPAQAVVKYPGAVVDGFDPANDLNHAVYFLDWYDANKARNVNITITSLLRQHMSAATYHADGKLVHPVPQVRMRQVVIAHEHAIADSAAVHSCASISLARAVTVATLKAAE
jgi:hypothetical protein